jgi:hypothetical protein
MCSKNGVEGYELFGFSGHKRTPPLKNDPPDLPGDSQERKVTDATPDLVQSLIQSTMKHFKDECLFPIETNAISKITGGSRDIYRCSFTFLRQDTGFPTGVVVQSLVEHPSGKVLGALTQDATPSTMVSQDLSKLEKYDKYEDTLPTLDALNEIKNN